MMLWLFSQIFLWLFALHCLAKGYTHHVFLQQARYLYIIRNMPRARNRNFLKYLILVDDSGLFRCTCFRKTFLSISKTIPAVWREKPQRERSLGFCLVCLDSLVGPWGFRQVSNILSELWSCPLFISIVMNKQDPKERPYYFPKGPQWVISWAPKVILTSNG